MKNTDKGTIRDPDATIPPRRVRVRVPVLSAITGGVGMGLFLVILPASVSMRDIWESISVSIGTGLISTSFIGLVLELIWGKMRVEIAREQLLPITSEIERVAHDFCEKVGDVSESTLENFTNFTSRLQKLQGRLEAFENLGLSYCHPSRKEAIDTFLGYVNLQFDNKAACKTDEENSPCLKPINIVSSSARGLIGYLDRNPSAGQCKWRSSMLEHSGTFRILLTHPSYAHLRQPAEERSVGDIEAEIIKTMVFLHCVCGMKSSSLRLYRGSPTVFLIEIGDHVLLNPYSYGKMAMDTLCLEFNTAPSQPSDALVKKTGKTYVEEFAKKHFHEPWSFGTQCSKRVDGKLLVNIIDNVEDILKAFLECTINEKILRFTLSQVHELDEFVVSLGKEYDFKNKIPEKYPFMTCVTNNQYATRKDDEMSDEDRTTLKSCIDKNAGNLDLFFCSSFHLLANKHLTCFIVFKILTNGCPNGLSYPQIILHDFSKMVRYIAEQDVYD